MLLFYAVECGLKAALLIRKSGRSTQDLDESLKSHDLTRLAKELRLPPGLLPADQYRAKRHQHGEPSTVSAKDLHLAWRYGQEIRDDDESAARNHLEALLDWVRSELRL